MNSIRTISYFLNNISCDRIMSLSSTSNTVVNYKAAAIDFSNVCSTRWHYLSVVNITKPNICDISSPEGVSPRLCTFCVKHGGGRTMVSHAWEAEKMTRKRNCGETTGYRHFVTAWSQLWTVGFWTLVVTVTFTVFAVSFWRHNIFFYLYLSVCRNIASSLAPWYHDQ